jgi:hypothetical protein
MARTFENPANRHQETVDGSDSLGVFFLGMLYLLYKGLWAHVLVWCLVVVVPALSFGPFLIFSLPLASIGYAVTIQGILSSRYLNKGWREVTAAEQPPSPGRVIASATAATPVSDGMKLCPYCAEEVKAAATKCKHCQSDLPITVPTVDTGSPHIKYHDGMYMVGGYHFDKLEEAQLCLAQWVGPKP